MTNTIYKHCIVYCSYYVVNFAVNSCHHRSWS